jgi:hypothetical protein
MVLCTVLWQMYGLQRNLIGMSKICPVISTVFSTSKHAAAEAKTYCFGGSSADEGVNTNLKTTCFIV